MDVKLSLHGSVTLNRNRHCNLVAFKGILVFCFSLTHFSHSAEWILDGWRHTKEEPLCDRLVGITDIATPLRKLTNGQITNDVNFGTFQASAVTLIRCSFFWVVTKRMLVVINGRFGTSYRSFLQGSSSRRRMLETGRRVVMQAVMDSQENWANLSDWWMGKNRRGRTLKHRRKKRSNLTSSLTLRENPSPSTVSLTVTDKDLQCGPNSEHILISSWRQAFLGSLAFGVFTPQL